MSNKITPPETHIASTREKVSLNSSTVIARHWCFVVSSDVRLRRGVGVGHKQGLLGSKKGFLNT